MLLDPDNWICLSLTSNHRDEPNVYCNFTLNRSNVTLILILEQLNDHDFQNLT